MAVPPTKLGITWPVPLQKIPCALGLTSRSSSITKLPIFILFSILPIPSFPLLLGLLDCGGFPLLLGPNIPLAWPLGHGNGHICPLHQLHCPIERSGFFMLTSWAMVEYRPQTKMFRTQLSSYSEILSSTASKRRE